MRAARSAAFRLTWCRSWFGLGSLALLPVLAACGDLSHPVAPNLSKGATQSHVEIPISIDQVYPICPPPGNTDLAHSVWIGTFTFDWTTTPSGISNGRASLTFDRSLSYTELDGVTYRFVGGSELYEHFLVKPDGMYVETGMFLDFERSDTGDRINTQATFIMVIDPNGNVRLDGVNHGVFTTAHCGR
jgi:hypothetical protein